jgi:hypothetical protein
MDDEMVQALKAAVRQTLLVAGIGLMLLGSATLGTAMSDLVRVPGAGQGFVWLVVGVLLTVFSRLAPPPTSAF